MEEKQLNFYRPLLSVRRFSSTIPSENDEKGVTDNSQSKKQLLPSYKSELKSGPMSNQGTVPFRWEQIPGRPKDEIRPRNHAVERPPIAPKPPPGRTLKTTKQDSDINSEHPSLSKSHGEIHCGSYSVSASNQNVTKPESSKDTMEVESSDSGEGDEMYLDALDTLSRAESSFLNCSLSGISEFKDSGVNTSGTFLTDPQTRDFMMGRFLPAAKAMISETPQYAPKKQPVVREQPRQMMKVVSGTQLRYGPNVVQHYAQEKYKEESDDDYDDHDQLRAKFCGLLPGFCSKSSLCLLNPLPGMIIRTRVPMSPSSGTTRTNGRSSSAGSSSDLENEHTRATVYEQRPVGDLQATELHKDTSVWNYQSDPLSCPFNPQKLEGSSLYRRLQGSGMSSHHYEFHRSAFSEEKGVPSIPGEERNCGVAGCSPPKKDPSTFQELLADPICNGELDAGSPMIEKTLYVDIVHKTESPSISYDLDEKGENDLKSISKWKAMGETPLLDSSFEENLNAEEEEEENLKGISQEHVDLTVPSLADKSSKVLETNTLTGGEYEDLTYKFSTSAKSKVPQNVNIDFETQQPPKAVDFEKSNGRELGFIVPPPLPKSPSDSWLCRTLPSMSSRTPSLRSGFHAGNQASKTRSVHPKWETIVKTTKGQHQHVWFLGNY